MIAVGWENIRRSARLYQSNVSPAKLCDVLRGVGGIFGEVLGGKAFGDWSLRPDDGREFAQHGITPYPCSPQHADGKDRSDPAVLLEVCQWIRDRDDCDTVILGSGDSDYQVLVDRARARGRRSVLCAFSGSVARDLLSTTPLFPLEAELGIQLAEHGDVKVDLPVTPPESSARADDVLGRFVREMYDLESRMNYVGFGMLCSQWMLDWGLGWNEHECHRLVDEYMDRGIVERHEVFNPHRTDWPTSAVRLIRTHNTVREVLGFAEGPASNPVLTYP